MLELFLHASLLRYQSIPTFVCSIKEFNCVVVVEFASGQFIGSESSGFIEVIVRIAGGRSSSTPITVTVTPSVQSPVSATGRQGLVIVNNII